MCVCLCVCVFVCLSCVCVCLSVCQLFPILLKLLSRRLLVCFFHLGSAFQEAHSGSDNFCCISNLLPGRTYRCRVCATSAGGVGQVLISLTLNTLHILIIISLSVV